MSVVEQIGRFIEENTRFVGGKDLFLNYLPKDVDEGVVVRFVSSMGTGKLRTAHIVVYYISRDWSSGDREIRNLRELIITHRGLDESGWTVLGEVEIGNEGFDEANRQVTSLNFRVSYVEV